MTESISVIIPAFNASRYLAQAVSSCLAQRLAPLEVIVVDDGSTDDTVAVAARFGPPVVCLRQANAGPSAARNLGIRAAQGEFIAFLDADDWWEPEKLARQMERFRANPNIGLVHTGVIEHDEARRTHWVNQSDRRPYSGRCTEWLFHANRIVASSVVVKRSCLEHIGLFDESLRGTEDLDLWLRIGREFEFDFVDEPLIHYRRHGSNSSQNSVMMAVSHFTVLEKAWQADSVLRSRIGVTTGRRHLSELAFHAGYQNLNLGSQRLARRLFFKSMRYQPRRLAASAYWAATLLPPGLHTQLRNLKRRWARSTNAETASAT